MKCNKTYTAIPHLMRTLLIGLAALSLAACEWTEPENLDYRREPVENADPEAYQAYLSSLRNYKKGDHKVMIVTMQGTADVPSGQRFRPMSMPDSADYICIRDARVLHREVVEELAEVREKKRTRSLMMVDFAEIDAAWKETGLSGEDAMTGYFSSETEALLAKCVEYGFDGIMVSFVGNTENTETKDKYDAFMGAVDSWRGMNYDKEIVFRGSAMNVEDKSFLSDCRYIVYIAGEETSLNQISIAIGDMVRRRGVPGDCILLEVSVPSSDEPEQVGPSPENAASWVLEDDEDFDKLGLCVANAHDDYYSPAIVYRGTRRAITIMNK